MLIIGLIIIGLAGWHTLEYLDSMGRLQKQLKRDSLMQARCKVLANMDLEDKFVCPKCTDIKSGER